MTVVLCAKGYPVKYKKDIKISRVDKLKLSKKDFIYHAGTKLLMVNYFQMEVES